MNVNFEYIDAFEEKYDYWMRVEHLSRYLFAADILKDCKSVLDIACANGYGTHLLSNYIKNVTGIDRNNEYLKVAKEKYNSKNIVWKHIDVDEERIKGKYEGIVCFETLEHVKFPENLLKNLFNILNENGILLLSVPNSRYEIIENGKNKDTYHLHVFSYQEIIKMVKKIGFKVEKIYGQSYINKIVNHLMSIPNITTLENDARTIGYPNCEDVENTYSYLFFITK